MLSYLVSAAAQPGFRLRAGAQFECKGGSDVPVDMKAIIAEAARKLMLEKRVKKLTVKDIVEECSITRQTFYYHFADIPELMRWMLQKDMLRTLSQARASSDPEEGLRCLFMAAIETLPLVRRGMQSGYRAELEGLLTRDLYDFFERVIDSRRLYADCTRSELRLILRYHCQAIMGLFREWTDEDTKNLSDIIHTVYRLIVEGIPPTSGAGREV